MKVLVIRSGFILLGLFIGYFVIADQQKTRFLIDNNTDLKHLKVSVSTSGSEVFYGNVAQSMAQRKFTVKRKVNIGKSDIIHIKVELPDLNVYEEAYLNARGSDYVTVRVNHSSESLSDYEISISSFSIEDAKDYRMKGL